jgi:Asp-tRNA(Asn)/Glu-tRNA(Gln) amidotransferase A subunit family amidase
MDQFHVSTREFLSTGLDVTAEEYLSARRRRFQYVRAIDELLGDDGLLLTPSVASDGWLADGRLAEDSDVHGLPPEVYSTALQNVTGHPAISIPFGMMDTGLPFGLQVTAAHYDDYRLLDIADVVQAAYPWARTAPGYQSLDSVLT